MSFQAMAWAIGVDLPTKEKFVLLMLANHASGDQHDCYPSISTLCKETAMSKSSVLRAIAALEEQGYLTIRRRQLDGVNLPNIYTLNLKVVVSDGNNGVVSKSASDGSTEKLPVVSDRHSNLSLEPINKPKNLNTERASSDAPSCVSLFELVELGVDRQIASDFLTTRKEKKAPLTRTALAMIQREAEKAGWTLERALAECTVRGWRGFQAEWVTNRAPGRQPAQNPINSLPPAGSYGKSGKL